jgi:chemotaxis signal transduction protein
MSETAGPTLPPLPTPTGTPPERRACAFTLAGARFAVDVRSAREVVLFDEITAVPRAPRHLVGIANLRGTVMPIVDICALLGLPASRPSRSVRTLVVRDGGIQAAVVVDAVLGLEPFEDVIPPDRPLTAPAAHPMTAGWVRWLDETLALLDVPKILGTLRASIAAPPQEMSA